MKKYILFLSIISALATISQSYGMESDQFSLKPVMPQQQLLAKKDIIQGKVKYMWEECLKALNEIFPDLNVQKHPFEGYLIINWNFKPLPSTNENVFLIKNTIQNIFNKIPKSFMRFDKQTTTNQEQALRQMIERMMSTALIETILKETDQPLAWCTCIPEYKRITLALLVVNEIREKYPNKNEHLVYTSLAPGSLLQDYIIFNELLSSHTNILINIIDLEYPDIPELAKKRLEIESPQDLHVLEMKNKQEKAETIDAFKVKIAQIISKKRPAQYDFDIHVYQNAYEYIARAKQNPNEKSNVLILTDPSVGAFGIADFPSLANVIQIWEDQEKNPIFTLYLPRHHGAQLYELVGFHEEEKSFTISPKTMQYLRNQLLPILASSGATKNYTPKLVQAFLNRAILNKPATNELLAQIGFPQLMEARANLKKQALRDGYTGENLLQPVTPIKLGNIPVLLSWSSDAHISFQDLVWDTLAPNAIVYQLYATDPLNRSGEYDKIVKINPEIYKQTDVITPNSGRNSSFKALELEIEEQPEEFFEEQEYFEDTNDTNEPEEEIYFIPEGIYKRIL